MFKIWNTLRWRHRAKLKLTDPNRRNSDEYRAVLTRQLRGMCLSCGKGKITQFNKNVAFVEIMFSCGHGHKEVLIKETISIRESFKVLVVPDGRGRRHFVYRLLKGWFSSVNPRLKNGVFKEQIIDKQHDWYKERVVDASNSKNVMKDQEQPLSEHRGHGSAKFK